jgi:hypothetical protein
MNLQPAVNMSTEALIYNNNIKILQLKIYLVLSVLVLFKGCFLF